MSAGTERVLSYLEITDQESDDGNDPDNDTDNTTDPMDNDEGEYDNFTIITEQLDDDIIPEPAGDGNDEENDGSQVIEVKNSPQEEQTLYEEEAAETSDSADIVVNQRRNLTLLQLLNVDPIQYLERSFKFS